jgi:hypothetical protein
VHNQIAVQVCEAFENLVKNELGLGFRELAPLFNVGEQVSPWTELHNQAHVAVGQNGFEQLDVVFML